MHQDYDKLFDPILNPVKLFQYRYKKLGYTLLILTIPISIGILAMIKWLWSDVFALYKEQWGLLIFQYLLILSLIFLVFSKEKIEDEMIQLIRFKSFVHGVYLLIVVALMFPFLSNVNNLILEKPFRLLSLGDFNTSVIFLLFYIFISMRARIFIENRKMATHEK